MQEILRRQNAWTFLAKFFSASLLQVSAGICQRALLDESRMIRTQMGSHNIYKKMVAVHGTLCMTPLRNRNSNQYICTLTVFE
jgi:proline dehydrogenase